MRLKKLLSVVTAVAVALSAVVVAPVAKKSVSAATTGSGTIGQWGGTISISGFTATTDIISITVTPDESVDSSSWNTQFIVKTASESKYIWNGSVFSLEKTVQELMDESTIASFDDVTAIELQVLGTEGEAYTYSYDITSAISDTPNYFTSIEILPDEPEWADNNLIIPTEGMPSYDSDIILAIDYNGTGAKPQWAQLIDNTSGWSNLTGSTITYDTNSITCTLSSEAWTTCLTQGKIILNTDSSIITGFTSVKLSYKSEGTDTFKQVSAADASNKHRERMVKLVKLSDLENAASVDFTFTTKEKEHTKSAYTYYTSITADGATLTPGTGWVFVTYAITGMPTEASLENISANIVNK